MVKRATQTQIVNVRIGDLGKRKGKKGKKSKGERKVRKPLVSAYIPPFNPPPIVNFPPGFNSAQPNLFASVPPPPPQRQYAVRPESETTPLTGGDATVPVPLVVEGNPLKAKAKEPKLEAKTTPDITGEFATPTVPFGGTEVETKEEEEEVVLPDYPEPLSSLFPTEATLPPEELNPVKLNKDGTPRKARGPNKPKAVAVESIPVVGQPVDPFLSAPLSSERYFGVPTGHPLFPTALSGKYLEAEKPPPTTFSFVGGEVPAEKKSELERQRGMGSGISGTEASFLGAGY